VSRAKPALHLAGVFPAAITPYRKDTREPDYSGSLDLLDFLADRGAAGVCMLGSTGEFLHFSFEERQRLIYLGRKRSRVPLIANVTHSTLAGALKLADDAIAAGADALLIAPPYYFRYAPPEIEEFYKVFAHEAGAGTPLLLYNIPQFTSGIAIETVERLVDAGWYAGIKDSSCDWPYFEALLEIKRRRPFVVFSGSELDSARALRSGADGLILANACAIPEVVVGMARAIAAGDDSCAEAFYSKLCAFDAWIAQFPAPAGVKRAVELRGQNAGLPAVPLAPETQARLDAFSVWFREWMRTALR
jgi:dihydrodipicolinate synthase/N-acetylneuraminate lyase